MLDLMLIRLVQLQQCCVMIFLFLFCVTSTWALFGKDDGDLIIIGGGGCGGNCGGHGGHKFSKRHLLFVLFIWWLFVAYGHRYPPPHTP